MVVMGEWRLAVVSRRDGSGDFVEIPAQKVGAMRRLAEVGCAKPYRRSSKSWSVSVTQFESWYADFGPPVGMTLERYVDILAKARKAKDLQAPQRGALPLPEPAEAMSGRKAYWWFEPDDKGHTCI